MLDNIAFGAILEQPAGKYPTPFVILGAAHVQLNKCAGFRHIFPRRGHLASTQANNHIAHPQRLARFHFQVTGQAITLVEQADHRFPLGHGSCRIFAGLDGQPGFGTAIFNDCACPVGIGHLTRIIAIARAEQRQSDQPGQLPGYGAGRSNCLP